MTIFPRQTPYTAGADRGFYARELPIFDKRSIRNERKSEQYRGVKLTINLKIENSAMN